MREKETEQEPPVLDWECALSASVLHRSYRESSGLRFWLGSVPCLLAELYIAAREEAEASSSGLRVRLVYLLSCIQKLERKQSPPILDWQCAMSV